MNPAQLTDEQERVLEQGFAALVKELGVTDAVRFVQLCDRGIADYTAARDEWLAQLSHAEVWAGIAQIEHRKPARGEPVASEKDQG